MNFRKLFYSDANAPMAGLYVVETLPQQRTIAYAAITDTGDGFDFDDQSRTEYYRLSFPYIQWGIKFTKLNEFRFIGLVITSSKNPIEGIESFVDPVPLPNTSSYGVCMGEYAARSRILDDLVKKVASDFWTSLFTADPEFSCSEFLKEWQAKNSPPRLKYNSNTFKEWHLRKRVGYREGEFLGGK